MISVSDSSQQADRGCSSHPQEEAARSGRDDRPSVAVLTERKMDSSAVGNHNKVKVMATQLLAKFEENAPAQHAGLKRQVWLAFQVLRSCFQLPSPLSESFDPHAHLTVCGRGLGVS